VASAALRAAIGADLALGHEPMMVNATAATPGADRWWPRPGKQGLEPNVHAS
jgi:hypothetical protein